MAEYYASKAYVLWLSEAIGTEVASFDFGSGDTVQLNTDFIVEHMKDALAASGVYDVKANGQTNGATR